jgi:hypothetical protein
MADPSKNESIPTDKKVEPVIETKVSDEEKDLQAAIVASLGTPAKAVEGSTLFAPVVATQVPEPKTTVRKTLTSARKTPKQTPIFPPTSGQGFNFSTPSFNFGQRSTYISTPNDKYAIEAMNEFFMSTFRKQKNIDRNSFADKEEARAKFLLGEKQFQSCDAKTLHDIRDIADRSFYRCAEEYHKEKFTKTKPAQTPRKESGSAPAGPRRGRSRSRSTTPPGPSVQQPPKDSPKPKPVAAPVAKPVAKTPVETFDHIAAWASKIEIPVCQSDSDVIQYAKNHNIKVKPVDGSMNPHSFSAMHRMDAMIKVVAMEGKGKHSMKILSYFGANRDVKMVPPKNSKISVTWVAGPNKQIQGDLARDFTCRTDLDMGEQFDAIVITDVYQTGPDYRSVLNEDAIRKLCKMSHTGYVYGILRKFDGFAGADIFPVVRENKTTYKTEGVWVRENGLICFSPEPGATNYAQHPSIDFLFERHSLGVDIHEVKTCGPYGLFKFVVASPEAQAIGPVVKCEAMVEQLEIKKPGLLSAILNSTVVSSVTSLMPDWMLNHVPELKKTVALVHMPTYTELKINYANKSQGGLTQDNAISSVKRNIENDMKMVAVKNRFQRVFHEIVLGTVHAVLYADKEVISTGLMNSRLITKQSELMIAEMRKPVMQESTNFSFLIKIFGVGLVALVFFRLFMKKYGGPQ